MSAEDGAKAAQDPLLVSAASSFLAALVVVPAVGWALLFMTTKLDRTLQGISRARLEARHPGVPLPPDEGNGLVALAVALLFYLGLAAFLILGTVLAGRKTRRRYGDRAACGVRWGATAGTLTVIVLVFGLKAAG